MARTRRYMHGRRRKCTPFKHSQEDSGYPHGNPHREMSEVGDAQQKAMHEHDSKEAAKKSKKEQKAEYKTAKKEWKKGGKESDKPKNAWRNKT